MEKLKRDLEHIKKDGIDSGALFRRVRKYLKELAEYKETGLTQAELLLFKTVKDIALDTPAIRLVDILFAEQAGRLVVLPCRKDMLESCSMRHADNCFPAGGFCRPDTAVCIALHSAYDMGKLSVSRPEAEAALEAAKTTKEEI